jgi:tyrosinase
MVELSRRSFIAGAVAVPFCLWFEKYAGAQTPMTRYEVTTPQGQAMLKSYAKAVATMVNTGADNPKSWIFQWYTHFVKGSTTKSAEISRVFTSNTGPNRALAQETWNTCQAHAPGEDENYFLPWHRMFVYFFERIVRNVSGDQSFTLPYWNYSTTDTAKHGVMPSPFRLPNDTTFSSLFRQNRNRGVNQGRAIDRGQPDNVLNLNVMSETAYGPAGATQGFCMDLDTNLHGAVHVLVGNTQGMGTIPFAANDPIFWTHHCNVDRLWESWNRNGGTNPGGSWLTQQFIFADENGKRVAATVQDFLDIAKLGYAYDALEPAPQNFRPLRESVIAARPVALAARVAGPVALSAAPVRLALQPPTPGATFSLESQVHSLLPERKMYLLMKNLRAEAQPGVLYHVYLDLPSGTTPKKGDVHHVGIVNFFEAAAHASATHAQMPAPSTGAKFLSIEVTRVAKNLQTKGLLTENPSVTITPVGRPNATAKPVIGEITLVEQ